jgi:hypothetical protein
MAALVMHQNNAVLSVKQKKSLIDYLGSTCGQGQRLVVDQRLGVQRHIPHRIISLQNQSKFRELRRILDLWPCFFFSLFLKVETTKMEREKDLSDRILSIRETSMAKELSIQSTPKNQRKMSQGRGAGKGVD